MKQPEKQPEHGGLAGAVGSDETGDTRWNLQVEILERYDLAEVMGQLADCDDVLLTHRGQCGMPLREGESGITPRDPWHQLLGDNLAKSGALGPLQLIRRAGLGFLVRSPAVKSAGVAEPVAFQLVVAHLDHHAGPHRRPGVVLAG